MKIIKILFILFCFNLLGCKKEDNILKIEQISKNENEVVLRFSEKRQQFWSIQLPIKFEITNSSSNEKKFLSCDYIYNNQIGNNSILFSISQTGSLLSLSSSNIKKLEPNQKATYLIYSLHTIDTTKFSKSFFKTYLEKQKKQNQDTLAVGTLEAFKLKHPNLVESLIKGDSLEFQFITPENTFEKPIKIPVVW